MTDDELLERAALNMAEMWAHVARSSGGREERWPDAWAADAEAPNPVPNRTTLTVPTTDRDSLVARVRDFYDGHGRPYGIVDSWGRLDLAEAGYEIRVELPCMVRPAGAYTVDTPPSLRIEQVGDEDGLRAFRAVLFAGFTLVPWPSAESGLLGPAFLTDERVAVWVGRIDGEPVGCSVSVVAHGVVGVYLVATIPSHRNRGIGEALSWAATLADPGKPALLQASAMGRPVYERMGYREIASLPFWVPIQPEQR